MLDAKAGLVVGASSLELGNERAEELINKAKEQLENCGIKIAKGRKVIWDSADAIEVAEQLAQEAIDLLIILHATWVPDTIQYILVNTLKAPAVLWAVPFPETFSIASVQHFGSILSERQTFYKYVYGLPEDEIVISKINDFALASKVAKDLNKAKIGLIGPRQTWRVAGAQDMTSEEWDLTDLSGTKIIHVEMDEIIEQAKGKSKKEAEEVLQNMKENNKVGKVEINEERLIYACKIYLGIKDIFKKYKLTGAAAECYPNYSGLTNLPASWLADEDITLDTEGDVGHVMLMDIVRWLGKGGAVALSEAAKLDLKDNCIWLAHEGSSAFSLAETPDSVHLLEGGNEGVVVAFPLKSFEQVTMASLVGKKDTYRMLIGKGKTKHITEKEWIDAGKRFVAKLRFDCDVDEAYGRMLSLGIDHHLLIKEGDITSRLCDICDLLRIKKVYL